MAKVVAKKSKVQKHQQSAEILRMVLSNHLEDFRSIASGLGYSSEEIDNTQKFVERLKVVKE